MTREEEEEEEEEALLAHIVSGKVPPRQGGAIAA